MSGSSCWLAMSKSKQMWWALWVCETIINLFEKFEVVNTTHVTSWLSVGCRNIGSILDIVKVGSFFLLTIWNGINKRTRASWSNHCGHWDVSRGGTVAWMRLSRMSFVLHSSFPTTFLWATRSSGHISSVLPSKTRGSIFIINEAMLFEVRCFMSCTFEFFFFQIFDGITNLLLVFFNEFISCSFSGLSFARCLLVGLMLTIISVSRTSYSLFSFGWLGWMILYYIWIVSTFQLLWRIWVMDILID